jgi:maleate isomerase
VISIGVLTPHAAAGPEVELPDMAAGQVTTQVARIPVSGLDGTVNATPPSSSSGLRALTSPSALDRAAAVFPHGSVEVVGYASTSTGYAIGFDAETAMVERLAQRCRVPVAGASLAAVTALRTLDVHRVALVHPPWFDDEFHQLGAVYFRSQGFDVVSAGPADLPLDPGRSEPGAIIEWITRHVRDNAEAVFIGGNGFRAAQAIEALEERLGRPVLESNQVLLWSLLAKVDAEIEIRRYGRLFGMTPRAG